MQLKGYRKPWVPSPVPHKLGMVPTYTCHPSIKEVE